MNFEESGFETEASSVSESDSVDRRSSSRVRTAYRTAGIATLTDGGLCLIHNLSDGGAMVETGLALSLNDNVKLAIAEGTFVRGRVAWHSGRNVGIRFLSPIDCGSLLHQSAQDHWNGESRAPRLVMRKRAKLGTSSGTLDITIHDISQRGMKANHFGGLLVAQTVEVTLEGGLQVRGVVRWLERELAGVQFSEMLSIAQLGSIERL